MTNSIRASVTFSFKGETYHPSIILDLDPFLEANHDFGYIYSLLAKQNHIGYYSYEYEMLQSETLFFDEAKGIAESWVENGVLNLAGLSENWKQQKLMSQLTNIARQHMAVEQLDDIPGLKETLLAVYQAAEE